MDINKSDTDSPTASTETDHVVNTNEDAENSGSTKIEAVTATRRKIKSASSENKSVKNKRKAVMQSSDSTRTQNFQVRVKLFKARRLSGNNIKPLVRVKCGGLQPQTTRKKNGCDVTWNETKLFTLRDSMEHMKNFVTEITVQDSQRLRSECVVGSFKLDLGNVYAQDDHSYIRKWLLLTDPNDVDNTPRGYLKFSISILGAGDSNPVTDDGRDDDDDEDDVESNLLTPVGINLRTVFFVLRVYRAEDLPKMDISMNSNSKNLVDPYVTFSFCGVSKRTRVIKANDAPEWNEELIIPVKFPSFCETLKLELTDKDYIEDDAIGSVSIPLSSISFTADDNDQGFLPNFGPCFINIYDSPDKQCREKVVYRGRVFVQLTTIVDEIDFAVSKTVQPISDQVVDQYKRYMAKKERSDFCLVIAFQEASMIEKTKNPIRFEISMGNYTTAFTSDLELLQSTKDKEDPTYHYLPWGSRKPIVVLKSKWEDIEFRYRTLNMFLKEISYLSKALAILKSEDADKERDEEELAVKIIHMFDEVIEFCKQFSDMNPNLIEEANLLDAHLFDSRRKCLTQWQGVVERLKDSCSDVKEAIQKLTEYKECLISLSHEPQNSIPDIILRMKFSKKREAFARIPAHEVIYSQDCQQYSGRMCGVMNTIFPQYPNTVDKYGKGPTIACQLQAIFCLGLHKYEADFVKVVTASKNATVSVYAETFEKKCTGGNTTFAPLKKSDIICPIGWTWKEEWKFTRVPHHDRSLHHTEIQEAFEIQSRQRGEPWPSDRIYEDHSHKRFKSLDQIRCGKNWAVNKNWQQDLKYSPQDGWEYSNTINQPIWLPKEKPSSQKRRRRWYREIKFVDLEEQVNWKKKEIESENGWIVSTDGNVRRQWIRMMERESDDVDMFSFYFRDQQKPDAKIEDQSISFIPRICLNFERSIKLQIRVYIYQARNLLPLSRLSYAKHTPFVYAIFMTESVRTRKKDMVKLQKLCPCWNQTITMEMNYYGDLYELKRHCPEVLLQVYVRNDFSQCICLGQAKVNATLQIEVSKRVVPTLSWCNVTKGAQQGGAIMAAAEIFTITPGKTLPQIITKVPQGIAPQMARYCLDLVLWGVRDLKPYRLQRVDRPSVVIGVGVVEIESEVLYGASKFPNFKKKHYRTELSLPNEERFWPPIIIRVKDHRLFGVQPTIGEHVIQNISAFMEHENINLSSDVFIEDSKSSLEETTIEVDRFINHASEEMTSETDQMDWWTKYNTSKALSDGRTVEELPEECQSYLTRGLATLEIFKGELERQQFANKNYDGFQDFTRCFPLYQRQDVASENDRHSVGELKGQIRIRRLGDDSELVPLKPATNSPKEIIDIKVRVYVVRAYDLAPQDKNGLADPYVLVSAGKKKAGERSNYRPNTLNPSFGQVLELGLTIPFEKTLKIEVYDWDVVGKDDKIGETRIDLENRLYTKYWAWFGLPKSYCNKGINKWRWQYTPKKLLQLRASSMRIEPPCWNGDSVVTFNHKKYLLGDFEKYEKICDDWGPAEERLALYVLRDYPHIAEHVETRTLYSKAIPEIPQGELELWVDIFPTEYGEPGPAANICPREPKIFYVRVVVWNCSDIPFADESVLGEKMSDIYVKGWLEGMHNKKQKTDTHYRGKSS